MMRLDIFLAENGFFKSRSLASSMIKSGKVSVNGRIRKKPSFEVDGSEKIGISETLKYVSRAGLKLEQALLCFGTDVKGKTVLDIGASTGGFTDCLLKNGAFHVFALDVGSMQLDETLRNDKRVTVMENFNARNAKKSDFPCEIDMITMDVSFISQTLIYKAASDILKENGIMITLIKPQFEAGRENIGKGGIVKDRDGKIFGQILEKLKTAASENGFSLIKTADSPIKGGDGNREYLALLKKTK